LQISRAEGQGSATKLTRRECQNKKGC